MWAFTSGNASGNWHPVTWLSHMVDAQFYGLNPRGHHLTNVVLHTLSTVLLLLFLFRFTGSLWQSSFVAALFALHPLHVESVAWVAERKDVLSTFFWMLTLLLYAEYVTKRKPALYVLSLVTFILGLMSKSMLVTLPIVLLLIDFWPHNRYHHTEPLGPQISSLVREKIPFFVCSLITGVITIYTQQHAGAMQGLDTAPLTLRIENALTAYVTYIGKTLWSHELAIYYPYPLSIPLWQVACSLLVLIFVSTVTVREMVRYPFFMVGWLWFLVTLLPVIGLIQVGNQSMADRYTYIPVIGLFTMAAWGVPALTTGMRCRAGILALLGGSAIIVCTSLTWKQLDYWQNNIALCRHSLLVTTGNYLVHNNLGIALAEKGDVDAAIGEFRKAITINNNYFDAHYDLGMALSIKGDLDGAIRELQVTLKIKPDHTWATYNLENFLTTQNLRSYTGK